jgi:hypothetical protein
MRLLGKVASFSAECDSDEDAVSLLVDEVRACIGEVAELARIEAARVRALLLDLDAEVRALVSEDGDHRLRRPGPKE